jgi:hypothetical protein
MLNESNFGEILPNKIYNNLKERFNFTELKLLGTGNFGDAYSVNDKLVMKITKDRSEAMENLNLVGKNLKYIANPYNIFKVDFNSKELYVIILEKLKTSEDIDRKYKRLLHIFNDIFKIELFDLIDDIALGYNDMYEENKEKIDNYLNNNLEDKKFFNGLINIARETHLKGVESLDYVNSSNLGYKENGDLAFFDLGFGNYFKQSKNQPEIINVDEREIKYMPNSSSVEVKKECRIGGTGNTSKACNQGDINNLNLRKINEDKPLSKTFIEQHWNTLKPQDRNNKLYFSWYNKALNNTLTPEERKHFLFLLKNGKSMYNAGILTTKNENYLNEDKILTYNINGRKEVDVFINPRSLISFDAGIRGIISSNGDLYVIDDAYNVIHNHFARFLNLNGYPILNDPYEDLSKNIPVVRYDKTNDFYLGESFNIERHESNGMDELLRKAKQKNPQYNFYNVNVFNATDDPEDNKENLINESYSETKKALLKSKSIPKELKEKILTYLNGGSTYHDGGRLHGLKKPKIKNKSFNGVGLGADKDGFYVYTHRAASKRYESPDKIPNKDIDFIESTG